MLLTSIMLLNLFAVAASLIALWCVSLRMKNAGIIDIFWGCGFALIAWVSLGASGDVRFRPLLIAVMTTVWGLRLAGYLAWRNLGSREDYRYRAMRERHGSRFPMVSLVTVFGLQGVLMWVISLPVQVGVVEARAGHFAVPVGFLLWLVGLAFESIGDFQLARFKADPGNRGRVMSRGLWRYTRHPNYFGDFLVWWGLYLVAAEPGSWWWTVVGPLLMSFLLIRVSGVRMLEDSLKSRLAGYKRYVEETSPFVPLPPRRGIRGR